MISKKTEVSAYIIEEVFEDRLYVLLLVRKGDSRIVARPAEMDKEELLDLLEEPENYA